MNACGERLRQTREEQGLSLAQVAIETRILQQSLIALEEGNYNALPGDVVTKGFLRNYAQFLGLPVDEMIELYRRDRGSIHPIQVVPVTSLAPRRSYVLPSFFGVFFVTIALVGLTYVALSAAGRIGNSQVAHQDAPATVTAPVATPTPLPKVPTRSNPGIAGGDEQDEPAPTVSDESENQGEPDARDDSGDSGDSGDSSDDSNGGDDGIARDDGDDGTTATRTPATPATPATPSPRPAAGFALPMTMTLTTPSPRPTPTAPIEVEVSTSDTGESWLRVTLDGVTSYEQIMESGERKIFYAQRQVEIRAGNPTVVYVSVNGLRPEQLGTVSGQPVNWSWPPL